MRKIKLFLYNLKNSWVFLTVIFAELVLCMTLLAVALTNFLGVNNQFSYYNKKIADKSFVVFNGFSSEEIATVESISNFLSDDLSTLATAVHLGELFDENNQEGKLLPRLSIATPSLCENLSDRGVKLSYDVSKDYREAYIDKRYENDYKINQVYDIAVECDGDYYRQKVKIVGYMENKNYYCFYDDRISYNYVGMVVCDKLPSFAPISCGIFIDNKQPSYFTNLGLKALTVKEYYQLSKDGSPYEVFLYFAIIVILFTFVTILCNYVLSVDKMTKRNAILFVCGNQNSVGVLIEGIKMLFAFLLSFVVSIGISEIIIFVGNARQNIMLTRDNFYLSALIVLGLYLVALAIGFVKFVKTKPLKVISNERK